MAKIDITEWPQSVIDRFWANVEIGSENECWHWLRSSSRGGYGSFGHNRKIYKSHRIALATVSDGVVGDMALHSCDNPRCCNPKHLSEGDHARNMAERKERGRIQDQAGSRNPRAKLSPELIAEIRSATGSGAEVAARFGITRGYANALRRGLYWS